MKKRLLARALALFTALTMLSTTAFAATFTDLQDAIDDDFSASVETTDPADDPAPEADSATPANGTKISDENGGTYGYGWNEAAKDSESKGWDIWAWNDKRTETITNDDGTETTKEVETRHVKLYENVEYDKEKDADIGTSGITVKEGNNVNLDLNGHDIDRNPDAVLVLDRENYEAQFYQAQKDEDGNVVKDADGNKVATDIKANYSEGAVITVEKDATLTLMDSTATGSAGEGTYQSGKITGAGKPDGSGLNSGVSNKGTFIMKSGTIAGNDAYGYGSAVLNENTFIMKDGVIKENYSYGVGGGGVSNYTGNNTGVEFIMTGGAIMDNVAGGYGGGVLNWDHGKFTMENGTITGNVCSTFGGGVLTMDEGTFKQTGGVIKGNKASWGGDDYAAADAENSLPEGSVWEWDDGEDHEDIIYRGKGSSDDSYLILKHHEHTPGEWVETKAPEDGVDGEEEQRCTVCGGLIDTQPIKAETPDTPDTPDPAEPTEPTDPAEPVEPTDPAEPAEPTDTPNVPGDVTIPDFDIPMADGSGDVTDVTVTIGDDEVPLAGLLTLADLLEALREHEQISEIDIPEDFKWVDHELAQAIYWGLEESLVEDTEEEPLDPDEIVTVSILREVLTNFVAYKGIDGFTIVVEGEDDDAVINCDEILKAFFDAQEA